MVKIRHRIFEIYEGCEEATRVLTPRIQKAVTEATPLESWTFRRLGVSRCAGVTRVQLTGASEFDEATMGELREDFDQLAERLGMDSKVLVDFREVTSFDAACIDLLATFSARLRTKGSRIALCCLGPSVRESFFAS
jgi:anti-anti-sigma regulatory factor